MRGQAVSANYFDVLGVRPERGVVFSRGQADEAQDCVVISFDWWRSALNDRLDVLGQALTINGTPFVICGVAPAGFHGITHPVLFPAQFWISVDSVSRAGLRVSPSQPWLQLLTRLGANQSPEALGNWLTGALRANSPPPQEATAAIVHADSVIVEPGADWRWKGLARATSSASFLLLCVVAMNVGNALFARALERSAETALRIALGASTWRLVRMVFVESAAIATLAVLPALLLSLWLIHLAVAYLPAVVPTGFSLAIDLKWDWDILGLVVVLCSAAAVIPPFLSAWRPPTSSTASVLMSCGSGTLSRRTPVSQLILVGIQTCSALILVAVAISGYRSTRRQDAQFSGFEPGRDVLAAFDWTRTTHPDRVQASIDELRRLSRGVAGIETARFSEWPPASDDTQFVGLKPQISAGSMKGASIARSYDIEPGFLESIGVRPIYGRFFESTDRQGVILIDERTAHRYWGAKNPVGEMVKVQPSESLAGSGGSFFTIIGVVPDLRDNTSDLGRRDRIFFPWGAHQPSRFVIRLTGKFDEQSVGRSLQAIAADVGAPLVKVYSLSSYVASFSYARRVITAVSGAFAAFALVVCALGLFALIEQTSRQRLPEIGLRRALGASQLKIAVAVGGRTFIYICWGLAAGTGISAVVLPFIAAGTPNVARAIAGDLIMSVGAVLACVMLAILFAMRDAISISASDALRRT